jgi:hypothetical protein
LDLTPEDRERIYAEEKARLEIRAQLEGEVAHPPKTQRRSKQSPLIYVVAGLSMALVAAGYFILTRRARVTPSTYFQRTPTADDIARSLRKQELVARAKARIKEIGVGILLYESDNRKYPIMDSTEHVREQISPYMRTTDPETFIDPATGSPWKFNEKFSGISETPEAYQSSEIICYSDSAWDSGGRYCLFADTSSRYVTASAWDKAIVTTQAKLNPEGNYSSDLTLVPQIVTH